MSNNVNNDTTAQKMTDPRPIGVFDSGFGGLTVVREIAKALPSESILYFGDSARCPYGPRETGEVRRFVQEIGTWLSKQDVKAIVIACNTATAAGLDFAQQYFDVPVIGVIAPGAQAAVRTTKNRRVGVIATQGTIESNAYSEAIRKINPEITVYSVATPRFVEIAEQGIRMAEGPLEDYTSLASKVYVRPAFEEIARDYLEPLRRNAIDTLVLGCTHFPLLKALIGSVIGHSVTLISSAEELPHTLQELLERDGLKASSDATGSLRFYTTGNNIAEFKSFGSRVLQQELEHVDHVDLQSLSEMHPKA